MNRVSHSAHVRRSASDSLVLVVALWLFSSCATTVPPISTPDPSDPRAPIGVGTPYRTDLSSDPDTNVESEPAPAPAESDHAAHGHDAAELVYACPMHPDVTGAEGGACPRCGMTLVPRKDPEP